MLLDADRQLSLSTEGKDFLPHDDHCRDTRLGPGEIRGHAAAHRTRVDTLAGHPYRRDEVEFELNGESHEVEDPLTVSDLLERFELLSRRVAVAINQDVVPRSRFAEVTIRPGDRVEVIHAVGGGA